MDDEAKEHRRKQTAAHMRAVRQREKESRQDKPKETRGRKPTDNPHIARKIYLTEEEWTFCKAQPGGGSEFVRQFVVDYIATNGDMMRSEISGTLANDNRSDNS